MSAMAMFRQPPNKNQLFGVSKPVGDTGTEVVDLAAVNAQAVVRMAAKAPSDKAFGETHPGDLLVEPH